MRRRASAAAALLVPVMLVACGGGPQATSAPPPPQFAITDVTPTFAIAGTGGFLMNVDGPGFDAKSVVLWNGLPVPTQIAIGPNSIIGLLAQVPAADVASQGAATITVQDGSPVAISNAVAFPIAPPQQAVAGVIQEVTVAPDGSEGNGDSLFGPSLSATGRFVAFQSDATNLVPGPASGWFDIFVRDTCFGAPAGCTPLTQRVSVANDGTLPNGNSRYPTISANGRYVAFNSSANNLVPNDTRTNSIPDIFVRDTCTGAPAGCVPTTSRISSRPDGTQSNGGSDGPSISPDGRFIAYETGATDVVAGGTPTGPGAVVFDSCNGAIGPCSPTTFAVGLNPAGALGNANSFAGTISANDRYSAFKSYASDLVPGDTNNQPDVFLRDTCFGAPAGCTPSTIRISVASDGTQGNNMLAVDEFPTSSADGRFVPFSSFSTNLVPNDTNIYSDVFLRDTCIDAPAGCTPSTRRISTAYDGTQANEGSAQEVMSQDGRLIAFLSLATNLVPGDVGVLHTVEDIYVRDTCFGQPQSCIPSTVRVSVLQIPGGQAPSFAPTTNPALSGDGHLVGFLSNSLNFTPGGGNGHAQIFLARTGY